MAKRLKTFFPFLILLLLVLWVFRAWFSFKPLAARDWLFLYPKNLREERWLPQAWSNQGWGGMGRPNLYNWSFFYFSWPVKFLNLLGFSWPAMEKIIWFWPFLILGLFSSAFLFRSLFPRNKFWFLSPFLFLFNTFSLMMTSGGQMSVALAYAIAPLVLAMFIKNFQYSVSSIQYLVLAGLLLAVQVMFDPRVAYITMIGVGIDLIFRLTNFSLLKSNTLKRVTLTLILPFFVAVGLNFFWLLPALMTRSPVLPATYGETGWVQFLSFARFSDSLSLRHPFWPENVFGKTYFFQQEFLFMPLIAFGGLLFLKNSKSEYRNSILFFALLALVGAFLAKGSNPPFGEVYLWLFRKVPGFNMFRDPVKFYLLVAISYSVLIPCSLEKIYKFFKTKS